MSRERGLIGTLWVQPENESFEPEVQPNLPENCQIVALFLTPNSAKSLASLRLTIF